jgi:trigger factor
VQTAALELPPQAIAKQAERLRQQLSSSLDKQGLTLEQYRQLTGKSATELDEELRTEAQRDLTRAFVLDTIADAEQIAVEPAEIEAEIREAAGDGADAPRLVKAALARKETRDRVESLLRERKTVERLVALASGEAPEAPAASEGAEAERAEEHTHA